MILRRYGRSMQSVEPNFDSKALTEVGFRRDHASSIPVEEFEAEYRQVDTHELSARTEGGVHDEVESALLADLVGQLEALEGALGEAEVLVLLNEQGVDYPKTRSEQKNVIVEGENRLYFYVSVDPPLRIGRFSRSS
jgi:hypothetical protein